jgi:hypothetical protein
MLVIQADGAQNNDYAYDPDTPICAPRVWFTNIGN